MTDSLRVLTGALTSAIWLGGAVVLWPTSLWWAAIPVGIMGLLRVGVLVRHIRWLLDEADDDEDQLEDR